MNVTSTDVDPVLHRRALIFVIGIALLWLALGAGDWFMRFHWFKWQRSFFIVHQKVTHIGPYAPMSTLTGPVRRGGDISHLLGIPAVAQRYEDEKPAYTNWTDEFGFLNKPPTRDTYYPIVVVGDSYMALGASPEATFSARLSELAGAPVYNHAYIGQGSFWGIVRFLATDHFKDRVPRVIIWGVVEREISGSYFESARYQIVHLQRAVSEQTPPPRLDVRVLEPARLKKSLPNTSAIAQLAARIWNKARYNLFGQVYFIVVRPDGPVAGRDVLFYFPSIDAMKWSEQVRNVPQVAGVIEDIARLCAQRNVRLVIVLIPDKEQVYREHVPAKYHPIPPSALYELEEALRSRDIPVVNLLDAFRMEAAKPRLLYWTDDTHWNPDGIRLAAEVTWPVIRPLVESPETRAP
jgi:hypothetical protein